MENQKEREITTEKRVRQLRAGVADVVNADSGVPWELLVYLALVVVFIILLSCGVIYAVLKFFPE